MACKQCDNKGIIICHIKRDDQFYEQAKPCPACCDNKAYYRYIKERYGTKKSSGKSSKLSIVKRCNVLKFPSSKN